MKIVAWLAGALAQLEGPNPPPDPTLPPIILVHGISSCGDDMAFLAHYLRGRGRQVLTPTLKPNRGSVPIEALAKQLAEFADRELPDRKFDLVGFSMGGLVSRYYLQRLGGLERVGRFVTMATPHNGTHMARIATMPCHIQMRPGSAFLRELNRDAAVLKKARFTSIYTPLDTIIIPARSSEIAAAENVRVWGLLHPSFVLEKRCFKAIAAALGD